MPNENLLICPYCGSTQIVKDFESGIIYCANCGAILEEIDTFEFKPTTITEAIQHRKITPREMTTSEKDRKLVSTFEDILQTYIKRLKLPSRIMKQATEYFLEFIRTKRKIARDHIKYYAAAILYITAREIREPISLKKIIRNLNLEHDKFSKILKILYRTLKIKPKPIEPQTYLQQVLESLRINDADVFHECKALLEEGKKRGLLSGRDIRGVIGGIVYVVTKALGYHVTQKDVARICGITEVTIRNRFLEFVKVYEELTGRKVDVRKKPKKRLKVKF